MNEEGRQALLAELRVTLAEQIRTGNPPATADTFQRLRREGHAEEEVWRLLSAALLMEMNEMIRDHRRFDPEIWRKRLAALPRLVKL